MLKLLKKFFPSTPPPVNSVVVATIAPVVGDNQHHQRRGNALLAEGRLQESAECYRQAIAASPGQVGAYVNLGYVMLQLQQADAADAVLHQAVSVDPASVDAYYLLATLWRDEGKPEVAIAHFRRVLALQPDFENAYGELCEVLMACGQDGQVKTVIADALLRYPQAARFHYLLGALHLKAGEYEQAIACFTTALTTQADHADLHFQLASALHAQRKFPAALVHYQRANALRPDHAQTHCNLGSVLLALQQHPEALASYDRALQLDPIYVDALVNRSALLHGLNRYAEALDSCDRAMVLVPDTAETWINRGAALKGLGRHSEALASYERASMLKPDDAEILTNRGNVLQRLNRHDEALVSFDAALQVRPEFADTHLNQSLSWLQIGNYKQGWPEYEWRWETGALAKLKPAYIQPVWLGKESLKGKTVLLYAEQGLGDTIQFCRYVKLVAEQGATVLLLIPKALESLLSDLNKVSRIFISGQTLPPFDYHCPLMSLPLAFGTTVATVPCEIPYLTASPILVDRLRNELGEDDDFRIGLCWKGSTDYRSDAERSPGITPFKVLVANFAGTRAKFYTLLPDSRDMFRKIGGEDLGYELDQYSAPFAETTALIMHLDLVITCDTSIGHIAGALGKPVWIVLPFSPDWRWIRDREDSPWYPGTRLFRQTAAGDWDELFERVSHQLIDVIKGPIRDLREFSPLSTDPLENSNFNASQLR